MKDLEDRIKQLEQNATDNDTTVIEERRNRTVFSTHDRKLNAIVIGLPEENGKTPSERNVQLEQKVCNITETLNCNAKQTIADFHRIGKPMSGKRRPVIIKFLNIWDKRTFISEYQKTKHEIHLNYFIKEDRPLSENHKEAKAEAKRLNDEELVKARNEKRNVTYSYSGRSDGTVVKYVLNNGRWSREINQ